MKRALWISLVAVLAFATIILVRLPVQWVAGWLPPGIACQELGGTVWNGRCNGLVAQGVQVGDIVWQLHAAALLSRKVSAHVELTRGNHFARGDVEAASGGRITARNLTADLPLDRALMPQLPANLTGSATTNLALIQFEKGAITSVQGQLEAHNLEQGAGSRKVALGDYSLSFPAADPAIEPVGQLKSLSGPLDVQGTLKLTREPGFEMEGLVAAGPTASPELVKQLAYLGSPDAQGRRPFSLAATF
ncbi:MAG: type II secretion system protein N [Gammaproteobacteria bacterium]